MAIFHTDTASFNSLLVTGSGGNLFSVTNTTAPNTNLFSVSTGSIDIFTVDSLRNVVVSGSLKISGSITSTSGIPDTTLLNTYTGSNNATLARLYQTTASLNTYTGSNDSVRNRILQTTASLNTYTGSNDIVVQRLMQATSSINITTGSLLRIYQTTASLNTYTGSNDSVIARILQATASLNSKTGSFATTGSNQFNGNQTITGSLFVTSTTISDSILLATGSNLILNSGSNLYINNGGFADISGSLRLTGSLNVGFLTGTSELQVLSTGVTIGNSITDRHLVTGSLNISGSITQIGNTVMSGSLNVNGSIYKDGNKQFNYGQWASLETQTGSVNTAYAMKLETPTDGVSGFYVGNNASGFLTRIYSQNTGLYNLQFSAQLHTTANEACDFSVWFAMTGSNIAYSNTDFSIEKINGGGFQVAALNFLTPISSGSYVELYWSKTTANGQLQAKETQASPTRPATPSLIVTVTQVA